MIQTRLLKFILVLSIVVSPTFTFSQTSIEIKLDTGGIYINNNILSKDYQLKHILDIAPEKFEKRGPDNSPFYVADDLGLVVHEKYYVFAPNEQDGLIGTFNIYYSVYKDTYHSVPNTPFSGKITLNGTEITTSFPADNLNYIQHWKIGTGHGDSVRLTWTNMVVDFYYSQQYISRIAISFKM